MVWTCYYSPFPPVPVRFFKTYHVLDPNNTVWPATILVVNENFAGKKIKLTPYM